MAHGKTNIKLWENALLAGKPAALANQSITNKKILATQHFPTGVHVY